MTGSSALCGPQHADGFRHKGGAYPSIEDGRNTTSPTYYNDAAFVVNTFHGTRPAKLSHERRIARPKARAKLFQGQRVNRVLALWHPTAHQSANYHRVGTVSGWWVAHDGHISQITGPEWQYLFFDYPLMGTVEFSVEGWTGGWSEAHLGYAGLSYDLNADPTADAANTAR